MEIFDLNKNKNTLLNIGLIAIALIVAGNIFGRQAQEINSLNRQKEQEMQKNVVLSGIASIDKQLSAYKNLLGKKDASAVMNTLNNLAKESKVVIASIRPAAEQKSADYLRLPFDLTVACPDYASLGEFTSKIEKFQDVYTVETMDIAKAQEEGGLLTANLRINLIMYAN